MEDVNAVLDFIHEFSIIGPKFIPSSFLEDPYWFATLLKEKFNGIVYYDPILDKSSCQIGNFLFDINGIVFDKTGYIPLF